MVTSISTIAIIKWRKDFIRHHNKMSDCKGSRIRDFPKVVKNVRIFQIFWFLFRQYKNVGKLNKVKNVRNWVQKDWQKLEFLKSKNFIFITKIPISRIKWTFYFLDFSDIFLSFWESWHFWFSPSQLKFLSTGIFKKFWHFAHTDWVSTEGISNERN